MSPETISNSLFEGQLEMEKENEQLREQVRRLESDRKWTSVKDSLPELRDNVLCANSSGDVFKCMWQGHQFKVDCTHLIAT